LVKVKKEGIVLKKTQLGFENEGVLNPAAIVDDGYIHIFYRSVSKGNFSSIGYCKLNGPLKVMVRASEPILKPSFDYEKQGIEDPRITKIDDLFYLTYTAYDGINALGALALSSDLKTFEKFGIVTPKITYSEFRKLVETKSPLHEKYIRYNEHIPLEPKLDNKVFIWDKNVIFFPRRINNKLYFLHRIKPDIQIASVNNLSDLTPQYWRDYFLNFEDNIVFTSKYSHETSYIGGGCPPIETVHGWLIIYHSVFDTINGYVYNACAALLDLDNPQIELARLPNALFKPDLVWELTGYVNNVCFPTGSIIIDDRLYIYYGAADEHIACASLDFNELIDELLQNKI
jgi:predicted GH43/DUF377 family glycosyl hydrolase